MAAVSSNVASQVRSAVERHVHVIVHSPSTREGFALFGGHRPRHQFSRVYLGAREHRMRFKFHGHTIAGLCRKLVHDYGLVVFCGASTPPDFTHEVVQTPGMVDMKIPIPDAAAGPSRCWSRSALADISKVERGRFRCEVLTGDAWVDEFHRRFYEPSMTERHAREKYTFSPGALRDAAHAPGAEFLRIVRNGVWVGGCLSRSLPDGYQLQRLGWLGGEPQLLKDGVVSAIYWLGIRRALELGYDSFNVGGVAPYLEDGLMFFKGKWGGRLEPFSNRYGEFHLLLDPAHATCRRFLAAHSLVARGVNGDAVVYSARRPSEVKVPRSVVDSVSRWYRWLDRPHSPDSFTRTEVPESLRAWVVEEDLR